MDINTLYNQWLNNCEDEELLTELKNMNDKDKEDSFYKELSFGTGGLRGILGAGTNKMNIYTVAKATQGLADYLNKNYQNPSVVIGYDSRIKSDVFSKVAAEVFAANNIKVNIYPTLNPVPTVSFGTRYLNASAGVMVTASHNPSKYNGYKVYGSDGCQITTNATKEVFDSINALDIFNDVKHSGFGEELNKGTINFIRDEVIDAFIDEVKKQSVLFDEEINKDVAIVYSPLNGTGLIPVTRTLKEMGFSNVKVVPEQEYPDGNFPTCPYPNPEIKEAMALGMEYAKKNNADLLLATDPDCDRVGIAVKNDNDKYQLITGNETGCLLLDYICSQRKKHNKMPNNPMLVTTIVSTELANKIAQHYGVRTMNVLTGFKYIGEQIGLLEKQGKQDDYIFGFEESYGYLSGTYARDKDAVNASYLICEMFAYYKTKGITILDKLNELYKQYGYYLNTLASYQFEGASGFSKMQELMNDLRSNSFESISNSKVVKFLDYEKGIDNLPKENVLKYYLEDGSVVVVRPSGTEPKIKVYVSTCLSSKQESTKRNKEISEFIKNLIK